MNSPNKSRRRSRLWLLACSVAAAAFSIGLICATAGGQGGAEANKIAPEDVQACLACHSQDMGTARAVNTKALAASPHRDLQCQSCHSAITSAPHTPEMLKEKPSCGTCHTDQMEQYKSSTHSLPDKVAGDHPNCVTCHGNHDPHAITNLGKWPRAKLVGLCSNCHGDKGRMGRYDVDPDAVPSYNESFHGKALLRFGNLKVAICTDCHGHHGVLNPTDWRAPTNRLNAAKTCSQQGCHAGAKVNFAMSGANHLRLKLKSEPALWLELWFFRLLIFGIITGMLVVIFLDLRREVSGPAPASGRVVAVLITLSYLLMAVTLALAAGEKRAAVYTWLAAIGLLVLSLALFYMRRGLRPRRPEGAHYFRLPLVLRIQHICLFISFTLLAATGLPLRFAQTPGVPRIHVLFGGFAGARLVHRGAALVLIFTFVWHLAWLLMRWRKHGYKLSALSMLPNRKDLSDAAQAFRYYTGQSNEEPRYGRFQLREKLDYLAEYWGVPIMILSGLVLWFPIYWGNRLPEIGLSFAYIAHSYEATLAFLAIITWHMYNAHFNPSTFPGNPVWITGTVSEEEMEREHPLELERLKEQERAGIEPPPGRPEPQT